MNIQRLDEKGKVRQEFYEYALQCCKDSIEIWVDVENYEDIYQISNMGLIKSIDRKVNHSKYGLINTKGKFLKGGIDTAGYRRLNLIKDGKYTTQSIHKLVCIHFIPNPENKKEGNHKRGIKLDNRVTELEWLTHHENILHAWETGLCVPQIRPKGKECSLSKSILRFSKNGEFIERFESIREANKMTGIDRKDISQCASGKTKSAGKSIWKFEKQT